MLINQPNISVIVSTYNRPAELRLVLMALAAQDSDNYEVIVADDGSDERTKQMISAIKPQLPYRLKYIWQPDIGFRVAMARNKAVAEADGDYLIFLDGDSVPSTSFVRRHRQLAEIGWMVAGNRVLLSPEFTQEVLKTELAIYQWSFWKWLFLSRKKINRARPFFYLPLIPRKLGVKSWWKAKCCNAAIWKKDFLAVNGFDERYAGWGYEDSDLFIRLIRNGVKRKDGSFAVPIIHLWHQENDRSMIDENRKRLEQILNSDQIIAPQGVKQYL